MTTNLVNAYSATVLGGFWPANGVSTLTNTSGRGALRRRAAHALSRRSTLALQEMMLTLDGATAGSAASKTIGEVAPSSELGGLRTVNATALIDENSAAADVTTINADVLSYGSYNTSPPTNGDGNPLNAPGL